MTGPVAIDELRQAYRALVAGQFREQRAMTASAVDGEPVSWSARTGRAVLVAGCMPSAGASTVALALASHAGDARVVECCTVASSGLCATACAELGSVDGWVQGSRDTLLIERRGDRIASVGRLPAPAATDRSWTVLDSSWDLGVLATDPGWLGDLARTLPEVVLVTRATVPGMRRLDIALTALGAERALVAAVGADRRRWPKPVEAAMSPVTRQLQAEDRLFSIPSVPTLSVAGLTPDPLPRAVMAAVADLFTALKGARA